LLLAATGVFLMWTLGKTGSRGGFLALVAVVAYLLLWFRDISRVKRAGAVALIAILLVALGNSESEETRARPAETYFTRIRALLLHPSTDYNWGGRDKIGRMAIWRRGIGYMVDHPLLGVGAGAFPVAEGTLAPEARVQQYGRWWKWSSAHNALLEVGAEIGVPGLLLFVALLVRTFRTLSRIGRRPPGEAAFLAQALIGSLVGFVVANMFLGMAFSAYFYVLLGFCVGLAKVASPLRAPALLAGRRAAGGLLDSGTESMNPDHVTWQGLPRVALPARRGGVA
jgi:O-antigen ligase